MNFDPTSPDPQSDPRPRILADTGKRPPALPAGTKVTISNVAPRLPRSAFPPMVETEQKAADRTKLERMKLVTPRPRGRRLCVDIDKALIIITVLRGPFPNLVFYKTHLGKIAIMCDGAVILEIS